MNGNWLRLLLMFAVFLAPSSASARIDNFSFGVIAHGFTKSQDESLLRTALEDADAENLAFVVANGIKSKAEPCTDQIYNRRRELLENAGHGLILSLAASDWADCRRSDGRSASIERLNRVRDLFFVDDFSFGDTKIPLIRQSLTPKFRTYGENARWRMGDVLFATINLPAGNNHYLQAAGRNSEFEDRLVANRAWLEQLFNVAMRKNLKAIVIFCDGNPFAKSRKTSSLFSLYGSRDGFAEIRRKIKSLGSKFPGKVIVIHGQATPEPAIPDGIVWQDNLGELGVRSGWTKLTVDSSLPALFAVTSNPAATKNSSR
jgi:hypothetical protein